MSTLKEAKRIVFKVGTSTLTYDTGKANIRRMSKLAEVLSDLQNSGREVVLVTSRNRHGVGKLGLKPSRPTPPVVRQLPASARADVHI